VLIAYDRDEAGDQAAKTLAEKLRTEGIDCYRIEFPHGMDVNDFALKVTPAAKSLGLVIRKATWLGDGRPSASRELHSARAPLILEAAAKGKRASVLAAQSRRDRDNGGTAGRAGRHPRRVASEPCSDPGSRSRRRGPGGKLDSADGGRGRNRGSCDRVARLAVTSGATVASARRAQGRRGPDRARFTTLPCARCTANATGRAHAGPPAARAKGQSRDRKLR